MTASTRFLSLTNISLFLITPFSHDFFSAKMLVGLLQCVSYILWVMLKSFSTCNSQTEEAFGFTSNLSSTIRVILGCEHFCIWQVFMTSACRMECSLLLNWDHYAIGIMQNVKKSLSSWRNWCCKSVCSLLLLQETVNANQYFLLFDYFECLS